MKGWLAYHQGALYRFVPLARSHSRMLLLIICCRRQTSSKNQQIFFWFHIFLRNKRRIMLIKLTHFIFIFKVIYIYIYIYHCISTLQIPFLSLLILYLFTLISKLIFRPTNILYVPGYPYPSLFIFFFSKRKKKVFFLGKYVSLFWVSPYIFILSMNFKNLTV